MQLILIDKLEIFGKIRPKIGAQKNLCIIKNYKGNVMLINTVCWSTVI